MGSGHSSAPRRTSPETTGKPSARPGPAPRPALVDRLGTFIRHSRDGIVVVDERGTVMEWNPGQEEITGIPAAEALGRPIWELQHRLAPQALRGATFLAVAREKTLSGLREGFALDRRLEDEIERADGSRRIVESIVFPLPGDGGVLAGGVCRDVTAQRQLEARLRASEQRLALAVEASGQGLWDWDVAADTAHLSPEYLALIGGRETAVHPALEYLRSRIHRDDLAAVDARMKAHFAGETPRSTIEFRMRRESGEYIWLRGVGRVTDRDASGAPLRMVGVVTDITESKTLERQLAEANRQKDDFLAVLSHELRNPLAPVLASLQLLRRGDTSIEQRSQGLAIIERQIAQLTRLVDDLLDVTRVARGKVHLRREAVDLAGLVSRALEDHRSAFSAAGVELRAAVISRPIWIDGDENRLVQVIANLLGNAAKFTPAGGRVQVTLAREGSDAVLTVADSGVGIEPELIGRVFEPFAQAEKTLDRSRHGLGLGLALVKALVEQHGGTITADSDGPGRGSRFTLTLPIAPASPPALA
jgi:PAS domain S-box-containing protein